MAIPNDLLKRLFSAERFPATALFLALIFVACLMPAQSDTWWHLRTGEEITRSGRVLLQDTYTHTVPGRPWPDHEWLTQVVFYAVYAVGGMPLLTLLCAAAVAIAWLIVFSITPGPRLLRVALVGIGAALSSGAWSLRPQVLTMALFATTLWILVGRRYVWSLPPLFLLWANLHGAVALGGVLIIAAALASLWVGDGWFKVLIVVGGLCFIATTLTPLGLSLWLEMPQMMQRIEVYGIQEWRSPGISTWQEVAFWVTGGSVGALAVFKHRALRSAQSLTLVLAAVVLLVMATRSTRQVTPFFLCAVPAIAVLANLRAKREEGMGRRGSFVRNAILGTTCAITGAGFIGYAWWVRLPRLRWDPIPSSVIAAIDDCRGPLYNRYDEGGALLWFMKHRKVFMDSRQDPFPKELVLEHIKVEQSGDYQKLFDRFGIQCALTLQGSPLSTRLRQDGWTERVANDRWTVYARTPKQTGGMLSSSPYRISSQRAS